MFSNRFTDQKTHSRLLPRILWVAAWLFQAALWLFVVLLIADYWLNEVPATKNYYAAGLEQGFDALAGIVAATDPEWEDVRRIKSYNTPGRLNRLQGDSTVSIWLELDERPSWNSGMATLTFDGRGQLLWVRRHFVSDPPVFMTSKNGLSSFPVIKPRDELRKNTLRQTGGIQQ